VTVLSSAGMGSAVRHEAFFYDDAAQFFDVVVPFIEAGVQADEPVLVILERAKGDELRARLTDPSSVELADIAVVGANPGRIIPHWFDFVARHGGPSVAARGVGEPIGPARHGSVLTECQIHEALINVALEDTGAGRILCPYDASALPPAVLAEARRSHPAVRVGTGAPRANPDYTDDIIDDVLGRPLPAPPPDALDVAFTTESLPSARHLVGTTAAEHGLQATRAADLQLAVAEAAANALRHGPGSGRLRLWDDGAALVADVSDTGRFADLLAGRVRPTTEQIGGRGLWIAQQVCDLVQVRSTADGTTVRLHMRR
jgi:anti-sigma regulatory factor (Ser/Thr protein kinase)